MTKIVLVNGKKRSGKDFFSEILKKELEELGYTSEILYFAGSLKSIAATSLQISAEELDECKNFPAEYPVTLTLPSHEMDGGKCEVQRDLREFLQYLGTDAMKEWFGENVWVHLLRERADATDADFVIVPDFRFLSEHISNLTIRVFNDDVVSTDTHRSETELDDFDFEWTVDNTGHPDLTEAAQKIAESLIYD